jgi:hypothetical protein
MAAPPQPADPADPPQADSPGAGGPETRLVSFVVRFVCDAPSPAGTPAASWHGVIRHVQSDAERYFTQWEDAQAFMAQYVAVGDNQHGG